MAVISEVAANGQSGLQINQPGSSRILKTLHGSWSHLTLAGLIQMDTKRLMPNEERTQGWGPVPSMKRRCGCMEPKYSMICD